MKLSPVISPITVGASARLGRSPSAHPVTADAARTTPAAARQTCACGLVIGAQATGRPPPFLGPRVASLHVIRLDAATVLLQWSAGGLAFLWFSTRERAIGPGYGWLLRSIYVTMA